MFKTSSNGKGRSGALQEAKPKEILLVDGDGSDSTCGTLDPMATNSDGIASVERFHATCSVRAPLVSIETMLNAAGSGGKGAVIRITKVTGSSTQEHVAYYRRFEARTKWDWARSIFTFNNRCELFFIKLKGIAIWVKKANSY